MSSEPPVIHQATLPSLSGEINPPPCFKSSLGSPAVSPEDDNNSQTVYVAACILYDSIPPNLPIPSSL